MKSDEYKTITKPSAEALYKDRNSKFYGYAYPVDCEEKVKIHLHELRKAHHTARHWCYAYQLGTIKADTIYRANDDGEPNNSAGMPIYGQILSYNLTNVLVVVVRYFGGTKLGVGGLINAYRTAAEMALNNAEIVKKTIRKYYILKFEYEDMNSVMRLIKENDITIEANESGLNCKMKISVRAGETKKLEDLFQSLYKVKIKQI